MIQREAATLRNEVLRHVKSLFPDATNARKYLHPKYAFRMMGFIYEERPNLDMELRVVGESTGIRRSVIAGRLDRRSKVVATSESLPPEERLFTAAHELGHLVLHEHAIEHRDRPIDLLTQRPEHEKEADAFAAAYLMPSKWIARDLESRFGSVPIRVDENLAWWLDKNDYERLLRPSEDADIERAKAVSVCTNVGEGHFVSIKDEYGVTVTAMALRLIELDVIKRT